MMMWSCVSSSKASCLLQFNDGVSALKTAPATCVSIRQGARPCPCASMRVHVLIALQCASVCRPTHYSIFGSVSASHLWSPFQLRFMHVHALVCVSISRHARPCDAMRVHVLQFASMRAHASFSGTHMFGMLKFQVPEAEVIYLVKYFIFS